MKKDSFIIFYDITNNRKRLKISKTLENYGERIQKSVFKCNLSERNFSILTDKLSQIIEDFEEYSGEDSLLIFRKAHTDDIFFLEKKEVSFEEETFQVF